jgi:ribonuclease HI
MQNIEGIFDGCCEPTNPGGHAAWGAVIKINGEKVWESSGYCGVGPMMSNNVAEYSGCLAVLEYVKTIPGSLLIRGDSKLVIEQLSGRWNTNCTACGKPLGKKCFCRVPKPGLYYPMYLKAKSILDEQRKFRSIKFKWVPREQNADCDFLSKEELRKRGVVFRIQPEK